MSDGQMQGQEQVGNIDAANANTQNNQQQQPGHGQQGTQQSVQQNGQGHQQQNQNGQGVDQSLAGGGQQQQQQQEEAPFWNPKWREKIAEHVSAGDKKSLEKEMRRLETMSDPAAIYAHARNLENTWATRNFVKLPGKDAKPEEITEFHKALGVPEKPEGYLEKLELKNGAVVGEADKPMLMDIAGRLHKVGAPPAVVNEITNWYYEKQEEAAAKLDEDDEKFRGTSEQALKEELGSAFKRKINATASLFSTAPGGIGVQNGEIKNEKSLQARLLGGRMADGTLIGNDPDFNRWLITLTQEVNPAASVVEEGDVSAKSIDDELEKIAEHRRTNRRGYFKDEKMLARERELLAAKSKMEARKG